MADKPEPFKPTPPPAPTPAASAPTRVKEKSDFEKRKDISNAEAKERHEAALAIANRVAAPAAPLAPPPPYKMP